MKLLTAKLIRGLTPIALSARWVRPLLQAAQLARLNRTVRVGLGNLSRPTPAKWVKVGLSLMAVSAAINGYGLTQDIRWVSYLGLACLVAGTLITNMFAEPGSGKPCE